MDKGLFVIISGPSGVGKGTIIKLLKKRLKGAVFLVSHTTRKIREGEVDGENYCFVSEENFKKGIDEGRYLEWACVHQKDYYGVLRKSVEEYLEANRLIVREVDVQGAGTIRGILPKERLLTIFIKPESLDELQFRIEKRGKLPVEEISRRMESVKLEMEQMPSFDYVVTNYRDQVESCYMDVEGIIKSVAAERKVNLPESGGILV